MCEVSVKLCLKVAERECGTEFLMSSGSNETEEVRASNCSMEDLRRRVSSLSCLLSDQEEPLEVSLCGNGLVEPGEECDCGPEEVSCDSPCCYPATISPRERAANRSALPCSFTARPGCVSPAHLMYGIYLPVLFIFIVTVLLTVFLRYVLATRQISRLTLPSISGMIGPETRVCSNM